MCVCVERTSFVFLSHVVVRNESKLVVIIVVVVIVVVVVVN